MPPLYTSLIFGLVAAAAARGICRDIKTGVAVNDRWTVDRDQNPIWYTHMILAKLSAVVFGLAEVAHGFGLISDPFLTVRGYLPAWLAQMYD